jgi:hypothetical protein
MEVPLSQRRCSNLWTRSASGGVGEACEGLKAMSDGSGRPTPSSGSNAFIKPKE